MTSIYRKYYKSISNASSVKTSKMQTVFVAEIKERHDRVGEGREMIRIVYVYCDGIEVSLYSRLHLLKCLSMHLISCNMTAIVKCKARSPAELHRHSILQIFLFLIFIVNNIQHCYLLSLTAPSPEKQPHPVLWNYYFSFSINISRIRYKHTIFAKFPTTTRQVCFCYFYLFTPMIIVPMLGMIQLYKALF